MIASYGSEAIKKELVDLETGYKRHRKSLVARVRAAEVLHSNQSEEYHVEVRPLVALTEIYRGYKRRLKALLAVAEWGAKPEVQTLLDSITERPTAATPAEEEPKPQ